MFNFILSYIVGSYKNRLGFTILIQLIGLGVVPTWIITLLFFTINKSKCFYCRGYVDKSALKCMHCGSELQLKK